MINSRPIIFRAPMIKAILENRKTQTRRTLNPQPDGGIYFEPFTPHGVVNGKGEPLECRFGQIADVLWVKESWRFSSAHDDLSIRDVPHDDHIEYVADGEKILTGKIRQSIFMPRRLSRITLEITKIRVERLQDISEEDAISEGVSLSNLPMIPVYKYKNLWESINGKESWSINPYVWVIEFKRINDE